MRNRQVRLGLIILFSVLALVGTVQAALLGREIPLSPAGEAFEVNLDSKGVLWVTDGVAGEIRAVVAASGNYTTYMVGGAPADARSDGAGSVWWVDTISSTLSRLSTATYITTVWQISSTTGLWGTALGEGGVVWASDFSAPNLYKLDPASNQLCVYTLPNSGSGEYLLTDQGRIWVGDNVHGRILRLNGPTFDWWTLANGSEPRDLTMDGSGRVWWTDPSLGDVGRLDPVTNSIITYTAPGAVNVVPQMLTLLDGKLWYTQQYPSRLVKLDPAVASGITATVTTGQKPTIPTCSTLAPQASGTIPHVSGLASADWSVYHTLVDSAGWSIYDLPVNAVPYGIAATQQIWLVDQGRQVLAKTVPAFSIYLPVINKS